jgi:hypothetical protein
LESPNDGLSYRGAIGDDEDIRFKLVRRDSDEIHETFKSLHKRLLGLRGKSLEDLESKLNRAMKQEDYDYLPGSELDYRFRKTED